jgi:hypothetical protein
MKNRLSLPFEVIDHHPCHCHQQQQSTERKKTVNRPSPHLIPSHPSNCYSPSSRKTKSFEKKMETDIPQGLLENGMEREKKTLNLVAS